jgi:hypothetical protein
MKKMVTHMNFLAWGYVEYSGREHVKIIFNERKQK